MAIDYSDGRYELFGQDPDGPRVGWAENGFAYSDTGTWKFRLDGVELSGLDGALVGYIEAGVASTVGGKFLFTIMPDA
jgi:hypothetical protein